jgi:hypothetical protein
MLVRGTDREGGKGLCCSSFRGKLVPPLGCQDREKLGLSGNLPSCRGGEGQETCGGRTKGSGWSVGFERSLKVGRDHSSCWSIGKYHAWSCSGCEFQPEASALFSRAAELDRRLEMETGIPSRLYNLN